MHVAKYTKLIFLILSVLIAPIAWRAATADETGVAWVVKPNASLQCEEPSEASLTLGIQELQNYGVQVLGSDFSAGPLVGEKGCDKPSFVYDSYLIRKCDVSQAEYVGFTLATPEYKRPYKVIGH